MMDVVKNLLLLLDGLACHVHELVVGNTDGVLLQRLVDSLLHLLSLIFGPEERLSDSTDAPNLLRAPSAISDLLKTAKLGPSGHGSFHSHSLLFPLSGVLISLSALSVPKEAIACMPEALSSAESDARVIKAFVASNAFDIGMFRQLADVDSWVDVFLLQRPAAAQPHPQGPNLLHYLVYSVEMMVI
jgi:hypothetical protein